MMTTISLGRDYDVFYFENILSSNQSLCFFDLLVTNGECSSFSFFNFSYLMIEVYFYSKKKTNFTISSIFSNLFLIYLVTSSRNLRLWIGVYSISFRILENISIIMIDRSVIWIEVDFSFKWERWFTINDPSSITLYFSIPSNDNKMTDRSILNIMNGRGSERTDWPINKNVHLLLIPFIHKFNEYCIATNGYNDTEQNGIKWYHRSKFIYIFHQIH